MIDIRKLEGTEYPDFHLSVLKSLRDFDRIEIEGVLASLFNLSKREQFAYAFYLRAQRNVDTLITLTNVAHFQAIAMLGRALFELYVDAEIFAKTPGAEVCVSAFKSLELLRAARTITQLEDEEPGPHPTSPRREYVEHSGPQVESVAKSLWPPPRKLPDIKHWTGTNLKERAKQLGAEVESMYVSSYRQFSWYVHGGLQGSIDVPPEHFPRVCGMGFTLAALSYSRLLATTARLMRLTTHDQNLSRKIDLAMTLPLTETEQDEAQIRRELGL